MELSEPELKDLKKSLGNCSKDQLIWISGFIQGLLESPSPSTLKSNSEVQSRKITVLYGTESGNSKRLASKLTAMGKKEGLSLKIKNLEIYPVSDLEKEEYVFGIVSTQGEGEPPIGTKPFFDSIFSSEQTLSNLKYGILALGDTSYPLFCKAGEDLDGRLGDLGGNRLLPLQKCDTNFETEAESWFHSVLDILKSGDRPPNIFSVQESIKGIDSLPVSTKPILGIV